MDDHPRLTFKGENGPFHSNGMLAVTPTAFGGQVLLLQVKSPQRLPEPQPESVDPEPVYWIALQRTVPEPGDTDASFDMAVFLKPIRPSMDVTLGRCAVTDAGRSISSVKRHVDVRSILRACR